MTTDRQHHILGHLPAPSAPATLAIHLLHDGAVAPDLLIRALAAQAKTGGRLEHHLFGYGLAEQALANSLARFWDLNAVDPARDPGDPRLLDRLGPTRALAQSLLPWRHVGGATVILTARPDEFPQHRAALQARFGRIALAYATPRAIEAAILAQRGHQLAHRAETRTLFDLSCRGWVPGRQRVPLICAILAALLATLLAPGIVVTALVLWGLLTLVLCTTLKITATVAALRTPPPEGPAPIIARLPTVSILVALHNEDSIAARLVTRLSRITYPQHLLDVLLVVEARDTVTRNALLKADLPGWMRVVLVPEGAVKTKPRALNHALDQCRGSIIGVYDAEDAPEPDQISRVVQRFHERSARTACLQGQLDYYNPRTNWLARCFTLEYASWFRLVLPGLDRLGLPVPLGGTTLFFRRSALEDLGAWDAWNVTEDADLGIRLARRGWRTEVIETVTGEEANCRAIPWVKQRSRWLKGYMMTYIVHMRDPVRLWSDLGPRGFFGFQVLFLGTLSQFLLAPLQWSFWLVALGFAHPATPLLGMGLTIATLALFLLSEVVNILVATLAIRRTNHGLSAVWAVTLNLYFILGGFAVYKALWELITRPFYWDKTRHGLFDRI